MEIYAFANQKGGVGKTSITLALDGELARRAVEVLVVDLDPQASATKLLAIDVHERPTITDVLLEPKRFALCDWYLQRRGVRPRAGRDDAAWSVEVKWDGVRGQLGVAPGERWWLRGRRGRDCREFPELRQVGAYCTELFPGFWRTVCPFMQTGAGVDLARNIAYLEGHAIYGPLAVISAWLALRVLLTAVFARVRRRGLPTRTDRQREEAEAQALNAAAAG